MTAVQLRKKAHEIIDSADERFLRMVIALKNEYEEDAYELSASDMAEVYRRSKEMDSGKVKGISLEELTSAVRKRLSLRGKV
ncbi:MAG TPA: hypothetical protein VI731_10415 [Bacteroidia bacterium]|nr:hypothetical protein [Bacteroidia bacterium]